MKEQEHVDVWEYSDTASATQHATFCTMCGQECEAASLRGSLWHELATFIAQAMQGTQVPVDVMRLLGQREKRLRPDVRKQLGQRSTYRVQKHLLAKCVDAGIPLLRPNGQPKGKTQLERELRDVLVARRTQGNDAALEAPDAKGMAEALSNTVH